MLRVKSDDGWWLITHPDHARLAADFAAHWGNDRFAAPSPREPVLHGIRVHDDGWAMRDAHPSITRQGQPSAFSEELVGRYSAFEEIDLAEYLAVRASALDKVELDCSYAALLVSMHTCNLLTERADRSTIAPEQLPLLDAFLERQYAREQGLRQRLLASAAFDADDTSSQAFMHGFQLLQAVDNLSLYSCVGYTKRGTLLHALPTCDGAAAVDVFPLGSRQFRLEPYPFALHTLTFEVCARHVEGTVFRDSAVLRQRFEAAPVEMLSVTITA